MDAVGMKSPAIHSSNFVRAFAQYKDTKSITVERKKLKRCESAAGRPFNLRKHRFVNRNIFSVLFLRDSFDNRAVSFNTLIEVHLKRISRYRVFSNRR